MKTPEEYHEKHHKWTYSSFFDCWQCRKAIAVCSRKISFKSRWDAQQEADLLNEENNYQRPLMSYRCRYCLRYHHTSTLDAFKTHRAERRRRKWLAAKEKRKRDGHAH
jgi:hypothetical protein